MMRFCLHLRAEIALRYWLAKRYWYESLASLLLMFLLFAGLLSVISQASGADLASGRLDGLVFGFVMWSFAGSAYSSISNEVAEEIRQRTLERLCLAALPLSLLLAVRASLHLVFATAMLVAMLLVAAHIGCLPAAAIPAIVGVALLGSGSLIGLGYAVAGMLLLARKAEAMQLLMYAALIGIVSMPSYPMNATAVLPFAFASSSARALAAGINLSWQDYLALAACSAIWLAAGILIFHWCSFRARQLGIMGHV